MTRRLLSPMRRRLYPNAKTGTGFSRAAGTAGTTQRLREGLVPGQADDVTWRGLVAMGWTEYDGPAKTDERGYVIPGSDPDVIPEPKGPRP